VATAKTF